MAAGLSSDMSSLSLDQVQTYNIPRKASLDLSEYSWFWGPMSRSDAEKLLSNKRNGEFLIRESKNYQGDYTISLHYASRVEHYRVRRGQHSFLTIDEELFFENMAKLVEHYSISPHGLCIRLKYPVAKPQQPQITRPRYTSFSGGTSRKQNENFIRADSIRVETSLSKKLSDVEVWKGSYNGSKVVVKVLKCSSDVYSKVNQSVCKQVTYLSALRHVNLVNFIGVSMNEPYVHLVTEFLCPSKGTLLELLRSRGRKFFTNDKKMEFSKQICAGMSCLESLNVIHGNLAAHNVLVTEDCSSVKITDFGVTVIKEELLAMKESISSTRWRSPEVLISKAFSTKADVWSFGVVLWEIYSTGRSPYPGIVSENVLDTIKSGQIMSQPDNCPDGVYALMRTTWENKPDKRPSFIELYKQLSSSVIS